MFPPSSPTPPSLAGRRVLVQGLGRFGGGVGVTRWLVGQGALVTVTDTAPESDLKESLAKLADLPAAQLRFKLGGHDLADFTAAELLVTNPAVDKAKSPFVQAAVAAGVPVTTEMNLFLQRNNAFTVGITGSVGKSTTTMLIYLALSAALSPSNPTRPPVTTGGSTVPSELHPTVFLGGNIGKSLLSDLPDIRPHDIVVLELSSFMLDDTPAIKWSPNIAVVTNLFPNHLDRYNDTLALYAASKQNILKFQHPDDIAILNGDHDLVSRWTHLAKGKTAQYSTRGPRDRWVKLLIPGEHNQSNAQATLAVLDALEGRFPHNRTAALAAMAAFNGLPHRLELVHTATLAGKSVRFYNDSKATSPDASLTAVEAFDPGSAIFIVGGYDKHVDLEPFTTLLAERCAGVVGIGQTGEAMIAAVRRANPARAQHSHCAATLDRAVALSVEWAQALAQVTAVVLSPASASTDQFKNYEHRGELFAVHVKSVPAGA